MNIDFDNIVETGTTLLTALGLKIIGAIIAWIIGRALIKFGVRLMNVSGRRTSFCDTHRGDLTAPHPARLRRAALSPKGRGDARAHWLAEIRRHRSQVPSPLWGEGAER